MSIETETTSGGLSSSTKKWIVISLIAIVITLSFIGVYNKEARTFITDTTKAVFTFIPSFTK